MYIEDTVKLSTAMRWQLLLSWSLCEVKHCRNWTLSTGKLDLTRRILPLILLAYGLPKETVAAMTIPYRNTKVKVRSPDGDTEYFDIVAGVLQRDTLAPYLFIICLDYVLRTSIDKIRENGFELTKKRSRRYPAKTITDADYTDDVALLVNKPRHHCLIWNEPPQALASMSMHTKVNICVTNKQATLQH